MRTTDRATPGRRDLTRIKENRVASKRFYWIKLKQSFYESNDAIDFLMSQSDGNGAKYVVLYQMLCLKTANNGGGLYSQLGEMIVPYDVDKIVRDCKYFERYIVTQALQLYKSLGLVYEQKDSGYLVISDIENMIGSESDSAERVRKHRNSAKALHCNANSNADVTQTVTTDIDIEKDIDIRPPHARTHARESFCETYGIIVDAEPPPNMDFEKLAESYLESTFLQNPDKPQFRRMSWIIKNYDKLLAGYFKDYQKNSGRQQPPPTKEYANKYVVEDD